MVVLASAFFAFAVCPTAGAFLSFGLGIRTRALAISLFRSRRRKVLVRGSSFSTSATLLLPLLRVDELLFDTTCFPSRDSCTLKRSRCENCPFDSLKSDSLVKILFVKGVSKTARGSSGISIVLDLSRSRCQIPKAKKNNNTVSSSSYYSGCEYMMIIIII